MPISPRYWSACACRWLRLRSRRQPSHSVRMSCARVGPNAKSGPIEGVAVPVAVMIVVAMAGRAGRAVVPGRVLLAAIVAPGDSSELPTGPPTGTGLSQSGGPRVIARRVTVRGRTGLFRRPVQGEVVRGRTDRLPRLGLPVTVRGRTGLCRRPVLRVVVRGRTDRLPR